MEIAKGLLETLKGISSCFKKAEIPFCLVGGLAVGIVSQPRATEDIDLLVLVDEQERLRLENALRYNFSIAKINQVMHFKNAAIWRILLHDAFTGDEGFIIVDFIFADQDVYRQAITNHITISVDGIDIPVATLQDLIAVKKLSNRPQDLIDIEMLEKARE